MATRKLIAVMACLALAGAAACGDDDDTETGSSDEGGSEAAGEAVTIEGGDDMDAILLPKCTGIAVFDQANEGAQEAAEELGASEPEFLGPSTCEDPTGQIETMTNAATQGVDSVMISNNAGEQIQSGVDEADSADVAVVSWDSPIPSGEGEDLFISQVDFDETGVVMADMALEILGEEGGQLAILSASPDAANQNAWIDAFETALEDELSIREGYAVVSLSWLAIGLAGAVPYLATGVLTSPVAALFESVSGFSTTGATQLPQKFKTAGSPRRSAGPTPPAGPRSASAGSVASGSGAGALRPTSARSAGVSAPVAPAVTAGSVSLRGHSAAVTITPTTSIAAPNATSSGRTRARRARGGSPAWSVAGLCSIWFVACSTVSSLV